MLSNIELTNAEIRNNIKHNRIVWGGNQKLKIYGTLSCKSGKKMKKENRVFFQSELEALQYGFRPCGHCMRNKYVQWKKELMPMEIDQRQNLLTKDGTVHYYGKILSSTDSDHYYNSLMNTIDWRNDQAIIFGRKIVTKRKVAWYGEEPFEYTYSKVTKSALPWNEDLLLLKKRIEYETGETFNSCLLNLYHSGEEGMAWHSDAEKDLKKEGAIASLSFGAERKFGFKHKVTQEKIYIVLEHGSLLVMKGSTQRHWLHRLPPMKRIVTPRINLTFRTIVS